MVNLHEDNWKKERKERKKMGEKKMIKKERKTPSQLKKVAAVAPAPKSTSRSYYYPPPISCPNLSDYISDYYIRKKISRSGGVTKSWISSCCTHQQPRLTWPQLVETNFFPEERDDELVKAGISSPAYAFGLWYEERYATPWRMRGCRITEPYSADNRLMEFTNVIGFRGKFYAISCQGSLALIEDEGCSGYNYEITALGRNRAVPHCQVSKHFREYLLEYGGEIYLVFLLSRASLNVVDGVEVFRLDRSRLVWEKVDRLVGDAMFFVEDNCGLGISASVLGCSEGSNCVYFTHDRADDTWFVYDMKGGCISTTFGPEIDDFSD